MIHRFVQRVLRHTIASSIVAVAVLLLLLGTTAFVSWKIAAASLHTPPPTTQSHALRVDKVEELGQLVVLKVHVGDVLTAEGHHYRGSWIISGDALFTVDISDIDVSKRDPIQQRATIILPAPTVSQPRVDHERTRTWDVDSNSWLAWAVGAGDPDQLRDFAMKHAQRLVEHAAKQDEHYQQARCNAAFRIGQLFDELTGWDVEVKWADGVETTFPDQVAPSGEPSPNPPGVR